jgi:hypothetical protein
MLTIAHHFHAVVEMAGETFEGAPGLWGGYSAVPQGEMIQWKQCCDPTQGKVQRNFSISWRKIKRRSKI